MEVSGLSPLSRGAVGGNEPLENKEFGGCDLGGSCAAALTLVAEPYGTFTFNGNFVKG